jgi:hypothetical protein
MGIEDLGEVICMAPGVACMDIGLTKEMQCAILYGYGVWICLQASSGEDTRKAKKCDLLLKEV